MQDASETCCDGLETVTLAKDLELEAAELERAGGTGLEENSGGDHLDTW